MGSGRFVGWRQAHQPLDRQSLSPPAVGDEGVGLLGQDAAFLWLLARVDLNVQPDHAALPIHLAGENLDEPRPVNRLDDIKQRHGGGHLVTLQSADQSQFDDRTMLRPPPGGFFDPVLAEAAVASGEHPGDPIPRLLLRHGCQVHVGWKAVGRPRRFGDRLSNRSVGQDVVAREISIIWRVARRLAAKRRLASAVPAFLFLTDPERTPDPLLAVGRLPRGAGVVYRAFGAPDALVKGRILAKRCRKLGLTFFVGADPRLAARLGARGLHLPQRTAGRAGDIRRWRGRFIVSAAAHDVPAVLSASRAGAQAILVSPTFASASPSAGKPLGSRRAACMARMAATPMIALGGINARTAPHLGLTGVRGVAVVAVVVEDSGRR